MSTELFTVEVDTDTKRKADAVFEELGMSADSVVNLLLDHVAILRRIPEDLGRPPIPCLEDMTEDEFDAVTEEGFDEIDAGYGIPAETLEKELYVVLVKVIVGDICNTCIDSAG